MPTFKESSASNVEVDFDYLPPILKRKFFSNVERLRIRQAQGDRLDGFDYYRPNLACTPRRLHSRPFRSRPYSTIAAKSFNRKRRLQKAPGSSQILRKPHTRQGAHQPTPSDLQYFFALPPKIQQTHFSPEERHHLDQAYRDTEIFDPSDRAIYRLEKTCRSHSSIESCPSGTTAVALSHPSTRYFDSSEVDSDDDMDESLYDSFRWLDEDGELDLTLDEYHAHVVNSTPRLPSRSRPSFRRTWSLNSVGLGRKPSSSVPHRKIPSSSQSSTVPSSLTNVIGRGTTSRPTSRQIHSFHAPRSSTSSVDPSAQYYQDPEARLKLRVYLASPQKFDEAVEFGFPALRDKESRVPERGRNNPKSKTQEFIGTFLEDEDVSTLEEKDGKHATVSRVSYIVENSQDPQSSSLKNIKRQTWVVPSAKAASSGHMNNREMTLKMTLTRPDLRTESPEPPSPAADPLKLEDLPSGGSGSPLWDAEKSETGEQGLMKKMWRKIRKQAT
ncbi:hypothetical protein FE257_007197 [Aspergillus nanangensis]|uniref:Mucin n=1 Tax=Aspergillus nanangensis TaxID=2582783 RepID=A0AAD4CPM6_ASPNN|nr:hypothetical protein FE257_007197 [Aspergillus nanangensis]